GGLACGSGGAPHPSTGGLASVAAEAPSDDMADMPGMAAPERGSSTDEQKMPCKFPWAPDGCRPMTPCAPLALACADPVLVQPNVLAVPPERLIVLTPPSAVRAPDCPPPRV